MKTFGFIGMGLRIGGKWIAMSMRVDEEIEVPKEISPPNKKGMLLRIPKKLEDGVNFVSGFIWCDSKEESNACLDAFTSKVESGEITEMGKEVNPNEIFN